MAEQELETRQEAMKEGGEATFWQRQLDLSDKDHDPWIKQARDVVDRYKSDPRATAASSARKKANILYSNTEVLKAALFARMAKPDVRRRFSDQDPTGRVIAELIERSLIYTNDCNDSESQIMLAVEDFCLPGRGIVRVFYEAKIGGGSAGPDAPDGAEQLEGDPQAGGEYVKEQEVWDEYVNWEDYRHEPTPSWDKLTWEAYRHLMTLDDLLENFEPNLGKEEVEKIPLNWAPAQDRKTKTPESFKKAEVWEVWDRITRTRIWIVKGYDKVVRKDKDPYGLEDFFPRPKPLQATTTTDTVIPQPLFNSYKDQSDALDEIDTRIDRLTKSLKRRGMYNAGIPELKKLATLGDNQFVPGEKWSEFAAGGGLKGNFETEDISVAANVLDQLHVQREQRIQSIYEIMGIADIMRGISDPGETLGAQQLKAQFGGNRLKKRQDAVQKFVRDLMRVKAEIIAEHFEPERLSEMTGFPWQPYPPQPQLPAPMPQPQEGMPPEMGMAQPNMGVGGQDQAAPAEEAPAEDKRVITPEIMEILRTDRLRSYRVDVETDSTIYEDAEAERTSRVELLTAMTQFVGGWLPIVQGEPALMPLAFEMLAFGVRGFKTGRMLEEAIEQTRMQLENAAKQQVEPPPDPAVQAEQAKLQVAQQKNQQDAQTKQAEMALKDKHQQETMQLEREKVALQQELEREKMALEREKVAHEREMRQVEMTFKREDSDANREQTYSKMLMDEQLGRDQMASSKEESASGRDFEREKVGLPTREGRDFVNVIAETLGEAFSKAAEATEKNTKIMEEKLSEVADKFGEAADSMAEAAADHAAPVSFETGPDGRIAGFTKGKRRVSIKRDPKTGKMQGAH